MPNQPKGPSFSDLLRVYRERAVDRSSREHVSQDLLAIKLSEKRGLSFNRNHIGKWESGNRIIPADERQTLIDLIAILVEYKGINTLEEANHLLEAGQYRILNDNEASEINVDWKKKPGVMETYGIDLLSDQAPALETTQSVVLYPAECGNMSFNLAQQRLLVSTAFGSYFAGLLERANLYIELETQVDCPSQKGQEGLSPLQRIYWLMSYAGGPRTMIIGGEGGMGKSTLAAKIIRCLHQEQSFDMILGDSAKSEHVDPVTREVIQYEAGYYSPTSFYERMCRQLGIPRLEGKQALDAIKGRLAGRRAIIVVDNLETVKKGDEILDGLRALTSRDVRALVTTRKVKDIAALSGHQFVVELNPIIDLPAAERFLLWHIEQYQHQHPALQAVRQGINHHIKWLVERTGGIPLLMQLIVSDVARYSWSYMQTLPSHFGPALLDFLYQSRWNDLGSMNESGHVAKEFLKWIASEQYHREVISSQEVSEWAKEHNFELLMPMALSLLFERFLIINHDPLVGNFSIYPSLAEFIQNQKP